MPAARVVREIPQAILFNTQPNTPYTSKFVVAAYARVSTDQEAQEDSFERQVEYYTQYIKSHPEWTFGGIYADPGISGTKADSRPEFQRMIQDCRDGKINKILTKSVSRFARNTVDTLNYIRELKELNISVSFENENVDTMAPGGEILLTLLAAMAEQESRTISSNIKWAYRKKWEKGDVSLNALMLGYQKVGKDKEGRTIYKIVEEEAAVIRRIFREYIAGMSTGLIAKRLNEEHVLEDGKAWPWKAGLIYRTLANEKYTGNAILGKTYKPDVLSKRRLKNNGQAPQYYVEHALPSIISEEVFQAAQQERERRKAAKDSAAGTSRWTGMYPFSGLLICKKCGAKMRRHARLNGSGEKRPCWVCTYKLDAGHDRCASKPLHEEVLEKAYQAAVEKLLQDTETVTEEMKKQADVLFKDESTLEMKCVNKEIIRIQEAAMAVHREHLGGTITDMDYTAKMTDFREQIEVLEERKEILQQTATNMARLRASLDSFAARAKDGTLGTVDDALVMKEMVDQIIVGDDEIEIYFKCGLTATQPLK